MIVFLETSKSQASSFENRYSCQADPAYSLSNTGVAHLFLPLAVLLILGVAAQAQTKSQSPASLIYERCHSSVVVVFPLDKDNKPLGQGSGS